MKIAICDDEPLDLAALNAMLIGYMEKAGATLILNNFSAADTLLYAIETGVQYDVIFLDVLMPGFSGIQVARELRKLDSKAELIFLTVAPDFALDAFSVRARDYLIKPLKEATLFRLMDELSARLDEIDAVVIYDKRGLRKLWPDRVEYCEAVGHNVIWHLRSGAVLESADSIQKMQEKLSRCGLFLRVHRSFLINLNCVVSFDRNTYSVELESMTRIPVPKAKFTETQQYCESHIKGEKKS